MAHIVYQRIDPLPAGFAPYWIQRELRSRLGFDGAVLSDDLSMKATRTYGTMPERARRSLEAGCDMVLVCNDRDAAQATARALRDYSNPLSLVRLARLHGTGQVMRESLLAGDQWQRAHSAMSEWTEPPELELDA